MTETTRTAIARVGVDLYKRLLQIHAVDRACHRVLAKGLISAPLGKAKSVTFTCEGKIRIKELQEALFSAASKG